MLLGREQLIRYEEKGNENLKAGVSDDVDIQLQKQQVVPQKIHIIKGNPYTKSAWVCCWFGVLGYKMLNTLPSKHFHSKYNDITSLT